VLLASLLLVAVLAPWLAPQEPFRLGAEALKPPGAAHPLGTDNIGRDLLSLVIYGARTSLTIGICAALMAFLMGCAIGATAGYFRGWVEACLMRVADLFQTLPSIVIILFVTAQFGSGFWLLTLCVALVIWPLEAKLIYGQFVHLRNREFVAAAEAAGLSSTHIVLREILPNAFPPIIVQIALDASLAIMIESGLGFLGLTDPSVPSWGSLLNVAQNYLDTAWWMSLFPGAAICLAVLAFNLFADGLNEFLNPRRSGKRISWSPP
jgi:peptide/nickel transport system permease protein